MAGSIKDFLFEEDLLTQSSLPFSSTIRPVFHPFSQLKVPRGSSARASVVRTGATLISPYFPEAWTQIAVLTVNDSLLLRLRKLGYLKQQPLRKMLVIRMTSHPPYPLKCPLTINITCTTLLSPLTYHFPQYFLPFNFCLSSFWCLSFRANFLEYTLSFESVGSRDITLSLNFYLDFTRVYKTPQYSGQCIGRLAERSWSIILV